HTRHESGKGAHAQRLLHTAAAWDRLTPDLLHDYLLWRHGSPPSPSREQPIPPTALRNITIAVVTWNGIEQRTFTAPIQSISDVRVLMQHGFLACSPEVPRLAIHLPILEVQHHARQRAFVSHEAWARILCDLHGVNVTEQLGVVLTLDQLQDEVPLSLSRLICGDGNNSSKRFAHSGRHDPREYHSDYILPEGQVDHFQYDVKRRSRRPTVVPPEDDDVLPPSGQGEPLSRADGAQSMACADKWKAAQAKGSGSGFRQALHETGHFLTVCRHAFILYSADMIQSGELAKYSLASLDKCMDTIGPDIGYGYDIGCSHSATVFQSSIGEKAQDRRLRFFVGAFHGYAHNRRCQLAFHPRIQTVAGLEDFETCEWIFSQQNHTARLFRHGSRFHRDFLYKNYRQALEIMKDVGPVVQTMFSSLGLSELDVERFLNAERAYLQSLEKEPDMDQTAFRYLETLRMLREEESVHIPSSLFLLEFMRGVQDEARAVSYSRMGQHDTRQLEQPDHSRAGPLAFPNLYSGYAMRTSIARALSTRSVAIRNALDTYNRLAVTMNPPRPVLQFDTVLEYAFLSDFSILRYSHVLLAQEVRERLRRQAQVDAKLRNRLHDIMHLPGYCGFREPGVPLVPVQTEAENRELPLPEETFYADPAEPENEEVQSFDQDVSGGGGYNYVEVVEDEQTQELDTIADAFTHILTVS
ncbi:hypothetical protein CALCODRAFT_432213, partial [Calocera cornea HHB12733]